MNKSANLDYSRVETLVITPFNRKVKKKNLNKSANIDDRRVKTLVITPYDRMSNVSFGVFNIMVLCDLF